MAKFTVPIDQKKRKRAKLFAAIAVIAGVLYLTIIFFFGERENLMQLAYFFLMINIVWAVVYNDFRSRGRARFAEINEDYIEWSVYEKNTAIVFINWGDVQWIKKEKDKSVTVYRDSSFGNNLSLADFLEEDQKAILHLFQQYGMQKQVQLINFSEPSLVLA